MNLTSLLTDYGPTAGIVTVVLLFLKYVTGKDKGQMRRDDVFARALDELTKSNNKIALYTKRGNEEAAQRNGHLAELTIQSKKDTIKAVNTIKIQHIKAQVVDRQLIKEK